METATTATATAGSRIRCGMTDENGETAAYGLLKNPADFLLKA
jgi:hypothetical protein